MKTLSGIVVILVALIGSVFLLNCAHAIGKAKCQGKYPFPIGLDANGCETPVSLPASATEQNITKWLTDLGVGKECYKIRLWNKDNQVYKELGDLDLVQCVASKSAKSKKPDTLAPSGSGGTQRVMFKTPFAKDSFEKRIKAPKK